MTVLLLGQAVDIINLDKLHHELMMHYKSVLIGHQFFLENLQQYLIDFVLNHPNEAHIFEVID